MGIRDWDIEVAEPVVISLLNETVSVNLLLCQNYQRTL